MDFVKDDVKKNYYDPNYHGVDLKPVSKPLTTSSSKLLPSASCGELLRRR